MTYAWTGDTKMEGGVSQLTLIWIYQRRQQRLTCQVVRRLLSLPNACTVCNMHRFTYDTVAYDTQTTE